MLVADQRRIRRLQALSAQLSLSTRPRDRDFKLYYCAQRLGLSAAPVGRPPTAMSGKSTPCLSLACRGFAAGAQHGRELRAEIGALLKNWRHHLKRALGGGGNYDYNSAGGTAAASTAEQSAADDRAEAWMARFATDFLAGTDYLPAIREWAPGLVEEVEGLARGAGQTFAELMTFQLMDEYWFHGGAVLQERGGG
eukprot:SAG11_NODE_9560_length_900_cov_2.330836_1_plen_195_part_10